MRAGLLRRPHLPFDAGKVPGRALRPDTGGLQGHGHHGRWRHHGVLRCEQCMELPRYLDTAVRRERELPRVHAPRAARARRRRHRRRQPRPLRGPLAGDGAARAVRELGYLLRGEHGGRVAAREAGGHGPVRRFLHVRSVSEVQPHVCAGVLRRVRAGQRCRQTGVPGVRCAGHRWSEIQRPQLRRCHELLWCTRPILCQHAL